MKTAWAAAALLVATGAAAQERGPAAAAATPAGTRMGALTVSYRSQTAVYVSAGRAAGLAVGDRLALKSGPETLAELEVVFLAEHSSSCRVIREARPLKPGDKLVRLASPRPAARAAAAGPPEIVVAPATSEPPRYGATPARAPRGAANRVSGGATAGYGTFRDSSGSGRDIEERQARLDLGVRDLAGLPLEARLRGSSRQIDRGLRGQAVRPTDSRQRLYEASLAWVPDAPFSVAAGRLGAHPFVALGFLDGIMGEARPTGSVQVGAFAGRTPDAYDVGLPTGAKYGAFVRLGARGGASPAELALSGVRELSGPEVSREYLGQQAQLRQGNVWIYQRAEIDFNTGWRRQRAGRAVEVSEARALLSWRATPGAALNLSYDRSRNYWSGLTRVLSSDQFDRRLRQTMRADLSLSRAGGAGLWMGASARTEEAEEEVTFAGHAGIRSPRLASLDVSVEASYYSTPGTRGLLATARAGRGLRAGHRLDFSYIGNRYQVGGGQWRLSHWLRASGYAQGLGRAFVRADAEYAIQDELPGVRALVEVGYRF